MIAPFKYITNKNGLPMFIIRKEGEELTTL